MKNTTVNLIPSRKHNTLIVNDSDKYSSEQYFSNRKSYLTLQCDFWVEASSEEHGWNERTFRPWFMNIFKLFVYEPRKQMAIDTKETLSNGCLILYSLDRLK